MESELARPNLVVQPIVELSRSATVFKAAYACGIMSAEDSVLGASRYQLSVLQ
jgi:hypothetical protein